jgi:hypothetical protein
MKRTLVLASFLVAFALAASVEPAMAQVQFASAGGLRKVRAEGQTEVVNEVSLLVSNSVGLLTIKAGTSLTFTYDAAITNTAPFASCSLNGVVCPASFVLTKSLNTLSITLTADHVFTTGDILVVSGVRVNVASLGAGVTSVNCQLSSVNPFPLTNPVSYFPTLVQVATVIKALTVSVTPAPSILSCVPPSADGPLAPPFSPTLPPPLAANQFAVNLAENFAFALTTLGKEISFSATPPATVGTELLVTVSGIPNGLEIAYDGATVAGAGTLVIVPDAILVSPQESSLASGTATFLLDIAATDSGVANSASLIFSLFDANADLVVPISSTAITATLQLAPVLGASIVRFANVPYGPNPAASAADCVTDLLWPYVATGGGFDTGITISNTTADPFTVAKGGAVPQDGTCTLWGWNQDETLVGPFTTPKITHGGTWVALVSKDLPSLTGGYIIGTCQFQNAHGSAFVFPLPNSGAPNLVSGYLALIIPNPALVPRSPATTATAPGAGEGLLP